jgi:phosphoserine phosphatase
MGEIVDGKRKAEYLHSINGEGLYQSKTIAVGDGRE